MKNYSEATLNLSKEIDKLSKQYNFNTFTISGQEKTGNWFKDLLKSDISFTSSYDKRVDIDTAYERGFYYTFEIEPGNNKEKSKRRYGIDSKYLFSFNGWRSDALMGGTRVSKIEEERKGFDDLESGFEWLQSYYKKFIKR